MLPDATQEKKEANALHECLDCFKCLGTGLLIVAGLVTLVAGVFALIVLGIICLTSADHMPCDGSLGLSLFVLFAGFCLCFGLLACGQGNCRC